MIKAQKEAHNESSTATFVSSVVGAEGNLEKSIVIDKEADKVQDDLFIAEQYKGRSESFKRFLQN